jgi:prophage regulatory protein
MMKDNSDSPDEIEMLRLPRVVQRCGLCAAEIYKLEAKGLFPKRVKLTSRASAWISHEVTDWLLKRVQLARGEPDA